MHILSSFSLEVYLVSVACIQRILLTGFASGVDSELSAVKAELDRLSKDRGTRIRQIALFKSLTKDVSEPTTTLVAKLNCETKRENQNHLFKV